MSSAVFSVKMRISRLIITLSICVHLCFSLKNEDFATMLVKELMKTNKNCSKQRYFCKKQQISVQNRCKQ